jgi:hypothetical protein
VLCLLSVRTGKKAKKKDPTAPVASSIDPMKETRAEKDMIDKTVKNKIKLVEAMVHPTQEAKKVHLPEMSVDAHAHPL